MKKTPNSFLNKLVNFFCCCCWPNSQVNNNNDNKYALITVWFNLVQFQLKITIKSLVWLQFSQLTSRCEGTGTHDAFTLQSLHTSRTSHPNIHILNLRVSNEQETQDVKPASERPFTNQWVVSQ